MNLIAHIDGGARGNPGPAGAGVYICDDSGQPVLEAGYFFGHLTNNQAEYQALLKALAFAEQAGAKQILVRSDSELLVRQINGDYRVRNPGLLPLFEEARRRLERFERWRVEHVMREQNREADALANRAMDAGEDVVIVQLGGASPSPVEGRSAPLVEVSCRVAPRAACLAPCAVRIRLQFDARVPAGLCFEAAGTIIEAVQAVRAAGRPTAPQSVTCPFPGCGAVFDVTLSR